MSGKLEIQWTPLQNKFITWGAEICLYQIYQTSSEISPSQTPTPQPSIFKISDSHYAQLLSVNTNLMHSTRSVDIYPKSDTDLLLAAGLASGRVTLTTFGPSEYDSFGYPGKEFVPRHSRHCNYVQFNPSEPNLIAAGLDKYRSDSSVLIWDVNKLISNSDNNNRMMGNNITPAAVELVKPVAEFGTSEMAYSLSWFYGSSRLLACGMNAKNIKIYDLRDPNKMVNSTLTKAVLGVSTNRNDDRQIVSFVESQVCVWDTRNFEKPIVILPQAKPVIKVGWCPTKQNCLASLQKESSVINLYNIQQTVISSEEVDPTVMERIIAPGSPHNITSFTWHQSDENRLLTIAVSGTIKDYTVFDRMTINWSATSNFVWSFGSKILKILDESFLNDITQEIKERAKVRYGLQEDFRKNAELVKNNESLANVWNWLHLTEKLNDESVIKNSEYRHPGVKYILSKIDTVTNKSEIVTIPWADLGYPNCKTSAIYYRHPDREKALNLCCWPLNRESPFLTQFLDYLERAKAYTRAAAIAVFNLRVHVAIDILRRAENSESELGSILNIVAMALSGFSDDPNSVWKQNCAVFKEKVTDPYLKAMFCFLTAEGYNYEATLNEKGIAVDDRVALACLYLPDDKLLEFIDNLSEELCSEGNLDGLLVTGNSRDGLKLLQKYLDNTADIQSTTLIAVRAFHDYLGTETVKNWIIHYRELLNTWRMFHERADFDIMLAQFMPNEKPPQQVYVSCSFCGKSVSASLQERGQYLRSTSSTKVKMSSCPNCRKPLPRCSICLMYMGTSAGDSDPSKIIAFENWFTWCQTCRHGGHAGHISEWFKEHQECPVSGCTCRCNAIDAAALRN